MLIRKTLIFTVLIASTALFSFQSIAADKYYKVKRADGSTEYTREKPNSEAKPVDLPGLSVITPVHKNRARVDEIDPEQEDEQEGQDQNYNGMEIASPGEQENLWGTAGTITVEVDLPTDLSNGAKVQLSLDGKMLPALESTSFTISEVYRGEHTLVARVVSAKGKVLASSPTRTFYIMMANVR